MENVVPFPIDKKIERRLEINQTLDNIKTHLDHLEELQRKLHKVMDKLNKVNKHE